MSLPALDLFHTSCHGWKLFNYSTRQPETGQFWRVRVNLQSRDEQSHYSHFVVSLACYGCSFHYFSSLCVNIQFLLIYNSKTILLSLGELYVHLDSWFVCPVSVELNCESQVETSWVDCKADVVSCRRRRNTLMGPFEEDDSLCGSWSWAQAQDCEPELYCELSLVRNALKWSQSAIA